MARRSAETHQEKRENFDDRETAHSEWLCLNSNDPLLDTVSTTCGSGWVRSLYAFVENVCRAQLRTHPLPQVVLTVSDGILDFETKPFRVHVPTAFVLLKG